MAARTGDKRISAQLKHVEGGTRGHSEPVDSHRRQHSRPPGTALRSCPSPAASEQTFLSLQVEAGAAGGVGCAANPAASEAERGAPISGSASPADP